MPQLDAWATACRRECADIIRELQALRVLPVEEQRKVIAFSKELDQVRKLTGAEVSELVERYQGATDSDHVAAFKDDL